MLPEQTITFRAYKGNNTLIGTTTAELSEISFLTETLTGSGIAGEMEVPTIGMTGSLSVTLNWIRQCTGFFSAIDVSEGSDLTLRASMQQVDEGTGIRSTSALRVVMSIAPKTINPGTIEVGKQQGSSNAFELSRLGIYIDDEEKLFIDKTAMIYRVNGKDLLASVRSDIGLEY